MSDKPSKKHSRKAGVVAIEKLIPSNRTSLDLWKSLRRTCSVANANIKNVRTNPDGLPAMESLTAHQKMKIAQDFIMGAVLSPEIGVAFLEEARAKPLDAMKLAVSIMPKELHVDVENKQGVIMVPMREESFEQWIQRANTQAGLLNTVEQTHDWDKIMEGKIIDGQPASDTLPGGADGGVGSNLGTE